MSVSNVFISHTTVDKPFVRKLALGLLAEGIPVWLDSWNLSLGDSLLDKIYDGIDASSVVILVISKGAVESGWVNRELNAALAKEDQVGRRFIIPVRIDTSDAPLKVADRVYADFASGNFSEPLSRLVRVLVEKRVRDLPVSADRELVGLSFSREVYLDTESLLRAWGYIQQRHPGIRLTERQVVVNDDSEYELLRRRLFTTIDNISDHKAYSPDLERTLRSGADKVVALEHHLARGVAELLSEKPFAIYWYAKMVRARIVYALWGYQLQNEPGNIDYGRQWDCASLGSEISAAKFFETDKCEIVDLWRRKGSNKFHLWIGAKEGKGLRDEDGRYVGPGPYYERCRGVEDDKYVFPQMMLEHLLFPTRTGDPIWDLEEALIGIA